MKKILVSIFVLFAMQTVCFADAETDLHQLYIGKIQAQGIKYSTLNYFGAIANGNFQLTEMFLKAGMSPDATFMKAPALYMAIAHNQDDIVKLLLDNNVDPNKEMAGFTPLILAIRNKDAKIVETLIEYGADVNKDVAYTNPLTYAIKKNQPKIVELLINAGAEPSEEALIKALKSKDNYIKETVLNKFKSMD